MTTKGTQGGYNPNEGSLAKLMHGHFNLSMLSSSTPPSDGPSPETQSTSGSPQTTSSDGGGSALARFGKAIYGRTQVPTSMPGPDLEPPSQPPIQGSHPKKLTFNTKSGILAMSPSPDWQHAVVAGRDFLQIIMVSDSQIAQHLDLFGSPGYKENHPLSSVSVVKWGLRQYSKYIVVGKTNGHIQVYDAESSATSKASYQLHEYNTSINSLGLNPHASHMLLSGNSAGYAKTWDMRSSNKKPLAQFVKNGDICRELKVSPFDSTKFAMIYDSGVVQRWDMRNPSMPERRMNAHTQRGLTLDWHEEFDYIVTGGRDKQVQIWNMAAGETARVPDHVINTPNGVHKARWQQKQYGFQAKSILDCDIASSSMDLYDYRVHIWSPRRKHIPRIVIEDHEARVSEVYWKSTTQLWTAARDNKFIQRDISNEEPVINELPKAASCWSATGLLMTVQGNQMVSPRDYDDGGASGTGPGSSAASVHESVRLSFNSRSQSHPKMNQLKGSLEDNNGPVEQLLFEVPHLGTNEKSICFGANNYSYTSSESFSVLDICMHNARVAKTIGRPRITQTWLVLHRALEWELEEWKKQRKIKQELLDQRAFMVSPVRLGSGSIERSSLVVKTTESSRPSSSLTPTNTGPGTAGSDTTSKLSQELSGRSLSSPIAVPTAPNSARGSLTKTEKASVESGGSDMTFGSFDSGTGSDEVSSTSPTAQEKFTQLSISRKVCNKEPQGPTAPVSAISILNGPGINPEARSLLTGIIEEGSFSSNSSVRSIRIDDKDKKDERETPVSSNLASTHNSHHSLSLSDDSDEFFGGGIGRQRQVIETDADVSPKNTTSVPAVVATPTSAMTVSSPVNHFSESSPPPTLDYIMDSELEEFIAFSQSLEQPWSPLKLLRDCNEYYLSEGDVQLCSLLALTFVRTHPSAFPPKAMVEEVLHCYITQLQKLHRVVAVAELINRCEQYQSIYHMGQTNTSVNQQCPTCGSVLADANSTSEQKAYWYCSKCHNLLDGCVLCRETVKGLAACILECGHYAHFECMRKWVIDDQMTECPSGCGTKIII